MPLDQFFNDNQIIFLDNIEKKLVIKEMITKMNDLQMIKSIPRYYAQVIHRESLENTGIGKGFAIPHARTESLKNYNCIFGISRQGIDYQSFDQKPVNYILLSLFPTVLSTQYLYLISMIAKIFSNSENMIEINNATTPKKLYKILSVKANNYFKNISDDSLKNIDTSENFAGVPTSDLDFLIKLDRFYKLYENDQSKNTLKKINELKNLIDKRSMSYYEKMHKKCETPFSIVEKNTCSGCHMIIPPIKLNEIKKRNKISICSYCGRFLIYL